MKRILVVEPYYGGSHKHFIDGMTKIVPGEYTLMTLPARKWKMRMQVAAPWTIQQLENLPLQKRWFDLVLCSTFIDVSLFRALTTQLSGWNKQARFCIYLHENQFAYPTRIKDPAYFQFTSINFNSCLAADGLAFNSTFNKETFLSGCKKFLKSAADMKLGHLVKRLEKKSRVLHPGLDFDCLDKIEKKYDGSPTVILWNHRWEHDKNPEEFFKTLESLKKRGVSFDLIILGQSFNDIPECFVEAQKRFEKEIIHFGFIQSRNNYLKLLCQSDIVVSTAIHEFYGISVIEAVRAGCVPVLPNRLSYPELFENQYLYNEGELETVLEKRVIHGRRLNQQKAEIMTDAFSWQNLRTDYEQWLFEGLL